METMKQIDERIRRRFSVLEKVAEGVANGHIRSAIVSGATGCGKTWLGCALAQQAGRLQVLGHRTRARAEAGLYVGGGLEALGDGLLGEQAGGEHDARVGGVGAGGDGGDDDVAVADVEVGLLHLEQGVAAESGDLAVDGRDQRVADHLEGHAVPGAGLATICDGTGAVLYD